MSRSIHANRSWRDFERRGFREWAAITTKRSVKRAASESRRGLQAVSPQLTRLPTVVVTKPGAPHFFPASRADIGAVLQALPSGAVDGLAYIRLKATTEVDSLELVCPGVRAPRIRGTYFRDGSRIHIFSY